jgi:hypothetical protein
LAPKDKWTPAIDRVFHAAALALLQRPHLTLLALNRFLQDEEFRKDTVQALDDPFQHQFWESQYGDEEKKAVAIITDFLGRIEMTPQVRNILGQEQTKFSLKNVIQEGGVLLVHLPLALLGEEMTFMMGSLLLQKMMVMALRRMRMPEKERRDFFVVLDDFPRYLSERLESELPLQKGMQMNFVFSNEYLGQMEDKLRKSVFGLVGSMASFRASTEDAESLAKEFDPVFDKTDLLSLADQEYYARLSIRGKNSMPFSARTLVLPEASEDTTLEVLKHTRDAFCGVRQNIEALIASKDFLAKSTATSEGQSAKGQQNTQEQTQSRGEGMQQEGKS